MILAAGLCKDMPGAFFFLAPLLRRRIPPDEDHRVALICEWSQRPSRCDIPGDPSGAAGLFAAALCEIVFRLFFLCFLREKIGKMWPGVLISLLLWCGAALTIWELPFGTPGPVGGIVITALFGLVF